MLRLARPNTSKFGGNYSSELIAQNNAQRWEAIEISVAKFDEYYVGDHSSFNSDELMILDAFTKLMNQLTYGEHVKLSIRSGKVEDIINKYLSSSVGIVTFKVTGLGNTPDAKTSSPLVTGLKEGFITKMKHMHKGDLVLLLQNFRDILVVISSLKRRMNTPNGLLKSYKLLQYIDKMYESNLIDVSQWLNEFQVFVESIAMEYGWTHGFLADRAVVAYSNIVAEKEASELKGKLLSKHISDFVINNICNDILDAKWDNVYGLLALTQAPVIAKIDSENGGSYMDDSIYTGNKNKWFQIPNNTILDSLFKLIYMNGEGIVLSRFADKIIVTPELPNSLQIAVELAKGILEQGVEYLSPNTIARLMSDANPSLVMVDELPKLDKTITKGLLSDELVELSDSLKDIDDALEFHNATVLLLQKCGQFNRIKNPVKTNALFVKLMRGRIAKIVTEHGTDGAVSAFVARYSKDIVVIKANESSDLKKHGMLELDGQGLLLITRLDDESKLGLKVGLFLKVKGMDSDRSKDLSNISSQKTELNELEYNIVSALAKLSNPVYTINMNDKFVNYNIVSTGTVESFKYNKFVGTSEWLDSGNRENVVVVNGDLIPENRDGLFYVVDRTLSLSSGRGKFLGIVGNGEAFIKGVGIVKKDIDLGMFISDEYVYNQAVDAIDSGKTLVIVNDNCLKYRRSENNNFNIMNSATSLCLINEHNDINTKVFMGVTGRLSGIPELLADEFFNNNYFTLENNRLRFKTAISVPNIVNPHLGSSKWDGEACVVFRTEYIKESFIGKSNKVLVFRDPEDGNFLAVNVYVDGTICADVTATPELMELLNGDTDGDALQIIAIRSALNGLDIYDINVKFGLFDIPAVQKYNEELLSQRFDSRRFIKYVATNQGFYKEQN